MSIQALYEKSLRLYLLTKYSSAANSCLKAINSLQDNVDVQLKLNIWTLYLNIASTLIVGNTISTINTKLLGLSSENSIEQISRSIWTKVSNEGFHNAGLVDAKIVSACLVMNLKLNQLNVARDIAEEWFAALPDSILDHVIANQETDSIGTGYMEVVDIYVSRVLTALNDFESANTFLQYNSILTESKKKALQQSIEEQKLSIEKEKERKRKLEEEAKALVEKKKKELEEKLRLEEEMKRMEEEKKKRKEELAILQQEEERKQLEKLQTNSLEPPTTRSVIRTNSTQETIVQKWLKQIVSKANTTSGAVLILIFALFALLRGQRGRLSIALQGLMNKLLQTIKMGTKVTYI